MNKILDIMLIIFFSLGIALAIAVPSPLTIGCAIFNGAMIGIAFALEYA